MKKSENEIRKTVLLTVASKGIKYSGIKLRKCKTYMMKTIKHYWNILKKT